MENKIEEEALRGKMIKFRYKRKDAAASASTAAVTSTAASVTSASVSAGVATVTSTSNLVASSAAATPHHLHQPQYLQPASCATLPKTTPSSRNAINSQTSQAGGHHEYLYQQLPSYCDINSYSPNKLSASTYCLSNDPSSYHEVINRMKTESVHQQHYEYMSCINSVVVSPRVL